MSGYKDVDDDIMSKLFDGKHVPEYQIPHTVYKDGSFERLLRLAIERGRKQRKELPPGEHNMNVTRVEQTHDGVRMHFEVVDDQQQPPNTPNLSLIHI